MSTTESSFIRPDGTPARVLVVDDESVLAELLGSALRHQGWETQTAANGWEALDKADTFDPDVVVLDIQMPGLDGMETLERLRKRKPHLPVLFLTARDAVADRVAGLQMTTSLSLSTSMKSLRVLTHCFAVLEWLRLPLNVF